MRLAIVAVGQIKDGPERQLIDDYMNRASRLARALGVREVREIEIADGGGQTREAERVLARLDPGLTPIRLDERGTAMGSVAFANLIETTRDRGEAGFAFLIGGADGHGQAVIEAAPQAISFGVQTWPHKLARVMLSEQIYRALSVLAGSPYHRA
jgi:23S rRNA (pseudouridine1915-N3)-methyltransferase